MKILICVHHLHGFGGSELICIELFEALLSDGHDVRIFCPFPDPRFVHQAFCASHVVTGDPREVDLGEFDLVFDMHQSICRLLDDRTIDAMTKRDRPVVAHLHLSPYEPFELPGLFFEKKFGDLVFANSAETRDSLRQYGFSDVEMFQNPAPAQFYSNTLPAKDLTRILSVSNHVPKELEEAFEIISGKGIEVNRIGAPIIARRVTPEDIHKHDAIVTIGKTVQYAIRSNRPVFCYDRFQGPGWLDGWSRETEEMNFSGRCTRRVLTAETLAQNIIDGYPAAYDWVVERANRHQYSRFCLEDVVRKIVQRVDETKRKRGFFTFKSRQTAEQLRLEKKVYSLVDREYAQHRSMPTAVDIGGTTERSAPFVIEKKLLRQPQPDEEMIVAAFSYRYDAHLVPDLLKNIGPMIHGYVALDDRGATHTLSNEVDRQLALFDAAKELGAKWIFAVDPDERFEDRTAEHIKRLTTQYGPVIWTFECRELFDPTRYRADGIWSGRPRTRLFPCIAGMEPDARVLHGSWTRNHWQLPVRATGLNFYHLRMATPRRRALRRYLYAAHDPQRKYQNIGYDYLDDDRGQVLREISEARKFTPPHVEDGGIWAPDSSELSSVAADSVDGRPHLLRRLERSRARGGYENAMHLACDISTQAPEDLEMALLAADSAWRAGLWEHATDLCARITEKYKEPLYAQILAARTHIALGEMTQAAHALNTAESFIPECNPDILAAEKDALLPKGSRFVSTDALWRRWTNGHASILEGSKVHKGELAVVVIGLHAPQELEEAIASIRAEAVLPEIVVVNSGGGDVEGVLAKHLEYIRLINIEERLFAGAARNIGVDASESAHVAFLASDCEILPGWVEKRIALHRVGYSAVAGCMSSGAYSNDIGLVASCIFHSGRNPEFEIPEQQKYSLSYARSLFESHGCFPSGMRIGEDTFLNEKLKLDFEIASSPEIQIVHKSPDVIEDLRADVTKRAHRRAKSDLFPAFDTKADIEKILFEMYQRRSNSADILLNNTPGITEDRRRVLKSLVKEMLFIEQDVTRAMCLRKLDAKNMGAEAWSLREADHAQACGMIQKAIEIWPTSAALHLQSAQIHSKGQDDGSIETAISHATRALHLNPNLHEALSLAMGLLISKDRENEACSMFLKAALISPRNKALLNSVRFLTGRYRSFKTMIWQKAFFLEPWSEGFSNALRVMHQNAGNLEASTARK